VSAPRRILLAHGSGGRLTHELVAEHLLPSLDNPFLAPLSDAAVLPELPPGRPALTTDGFIVDPPIFPGGNLGHLSICGTVNDLSVAGARPLWITWALILEEGLDGELLETCVRGAAEAAAEAGVTVVAGDTKVVPRGKGDRIFAVTAGLGVIPPGRDVGDHRIEPGDAIVASGFLGDHGATIASCRHQLMGSLQSDCAPLTGLVEHLFEAGVPIRSMHDPTRGGLLALCHEVAQRSGLRVILDEPAIPTRPQVGAVCDLLGLEPLSLACEGRVVLWVPEAAADEAVEALRRHPLGRDAARIGHVTHLDAGSPPVILHTRVGGERPLDLLSGTDLPRIC